MGNEMDRISGKITAVRVGVLLSLSLLFVGCAKGYTVDDLDADLDEEPEVRIPSLIRTYVPSHRVFAGDRIFASCDVYDEQGLLIPTGELEVPPEILYDPRSLLGTDEEGEVIAERVGHVHVACTLPQFGLYDDGVRVEILPSRPYSAVTLLESDRIVAGGSTEAVCRIFDRFGNEIEGAANALHISPSGNGIVSDALTVTATRADVYEVTCSVAGAVDVESDFLRVDPGLPHSMSVGLRPDRRFYRLEDQVLVDTDIRDRFGNRVTGATVEFQTSGTAGQIHANAGRFTFKSDGTYTLKAMVTSAIDPEVSAVEGEVQVVVNTSGPDIDCLHVDTKQPSEAYMLNAAPGTQVQIPVDIADTFNVSEVRINGALASHQGNGRYVAPHIVNWGMNFIDVVAKDEYGEDNSKTCYFLASNLWSPDANAIQRNTIGFRLNREAFGPRTGQLSTFADIIYAVANSDGLRDMIDTSVAALNPLVDGCQQRVLGACVFRLRLNYVGNSLWMNGPNDATLELVHGGLHADLNLRNVGARANVGGTCSGTPSFSIGRLHAALTFDLTVVAGSLRASVRSVEDVSIHGLNISCSFGALCSIVCGIFRGAIQNLVRGEFEKVLKGFLEDNLNEVLDSLLQNLDISTLAAQFSIPKIDNSGSVTLGFGTALDSGSITSQRALLGLGTRFSLVSAAPHNRPTQGAIHRVAPNPTSPLDPPINTGAGNTVGVSFYEGAVNQILHNLWMGGFFNLALDLGDGGAANPSVTIDAYLPPVAHISNEGGQERLRLMMGGIDAEVRIPPLIDEPPLRVMFGGVATAAASLDGDALRVSDLSLNYESDLYISFEDAVSEAGRLAVRDLLGDILVTLLESAVNDGLPAIPIPSFELPDVLADYGLPAEGHLRIFSPSLVLQGNHFRLSGGFGVE